MTAGIMPCNGIVEERRRYNGSIPCRENKGLYDNEQSPSAQYGVVLKGKGAFITYVVAAGRLGLCFHPRYALGDHHNHMDKDDFLREMYLDTVGHDEAGMKRYERMVNIVSSRFRHGPKTEERAIDEAMQKVISEKYLMLPLYLYDHSGLAMSTESFSGRAPHAEWDSGQVGWIYVSKEYALKEFDADKMTGAIRQKADALMRSEVAAYDSYLRGECYGFELYKNGELSDSCWGFMGNFSDVLKDMTEYLPDECKGMVDHLEEQERPATIIKTLLKHAKIQVDQAAKAFEHASRQQVLGESR